MTALLVPAFTSLKAGSDVGKTAHDIAGLLNQARAYALTNNTYVFVGFAEVNSAVSQTAVPQDTTSATPYGRLAVALVASRDGTRGYDVNNPGDGATGSWVSSYNSYNGATAKAANLVAVSKLQLFENVHLVWLGGASCPIPADGKMKRTAVGSGGSWSNNLSNANGGSITPFTWPLGSPLTPETSYQFRFDKVIHFDPQGVPRLQRTNNADQLGERYEIDFQPSRGNVIIGQPADQNVGQHVAVQIDGLSGSVRMYRP